MLNCWRRPPRVDCSHTFGHKTLRGGSTMAVQPYTINVPDDVLEDLRHRAEPRALARRNSRRRVGLRLQSRLHQGTGGLLAGRIRLAQGRSRLNAFANFYTTIEGQGIHFIHEKGKGPNPMPIIVTHGWPGSIYEMHKIIPLLTDPASHGGDPADFLRRRGPVHARLRFQCPDPATAASTPAASPSCGTSSWPTNWGYQRYAAQGGDWGAGVTRPPGLPPRRPRHGHPHHLRDPGHYPTRAPASRA